MLHPGPLSGIRVIDWTVVMAGPFATNLLATLGADVIKVEAPDGDMLRGLLPRVGIESTAFVTFNSGKRSVMLDLKSERDRAYMWKLIEGADVLVNNFRAGTAEKLGFGQPEVLARSPEIVCVASTAWGEMGPMASDAGTDVVVRALSGFCSVSGPEGSDAQLRFLGHADINTAIYIAAAVLTGLYARDRLGGQVLRMSMLEAQCAMQSTRLSEYFATGRAPIPLGSASAVTAPSQAFACRDGLFIAVSAETQSQWERLCVAIARPDLLGDPRFRSNVDRVRHRRELASLLSSVFAANHSPAWIQLLQGAKVPCAELSDWQDTPHRPQIVANEHVVTLDTGHGVVKTWGPPWKFREAPVEIRREPRLGEHNDEVITELEASAPRPRAEARAGATSEPLLPLAGLRVVEIASGIAGPYAGALFADHGATVTKIEVKADYLREWGPPQIDGVSTAFIELNRNKDVVRPDRDLLLRLAGEADVVLVDEIDSDGEPAPLTESEARSVNQDLIWCAMTPNGEHGPFASLPGSELTAQVMAACWSVQGEGSAEPMRNGTDQASVSAGVFAYQGALAALIRRRRTGRPDRVAVSVLGAMTAVMSWHWTGLSDPPRWIRHHGGSIHAGSAGYRTRTDPVTITLSRGAGSNKPEPIDVAALVARLGGAMPEGMDSAAPGQSPAHPMASRWIPFWEGLFARYTSEELTAVIRELGGDVRPMTDYSSLDRHPQIIALDPFRRLEDLTRIVRSPWRFVDHPDGFSYRAPRVRDTAAPARAGG